MCNVYNEIMEFMALRRKEETISLQLENMYSFVNIQTVDGKR